jgi:hypothetical protein
MSSAYGASGSRTWTGATDGDYYNGANWSPSGDFPNGNATFSGTVPNSAITKTGNPYDYIYGLIFGNTLDTQSSFTFSPGGTRFFVGGSSISTAAVTSGSLTDEIGVDVYLANAATAFDIGSNHNLKIWSYRHEEWFRNPDPLRHQYLRCVNHDHCGHPAVG